MKAKDWKCIKCQERADVFVGMNDPDAEEYPMCRKCADNWKMEVYFELSKLKQQTTRGR